jgi:TRAP-type C4-dicarboxylate transport system permease small subunit
LALIGIALGVALGRRWARWTSIVLAALILCLSALMFWDGYLRVKPKYSGEESSEVFGALIFSATSLCVLVAMFIPAAKRHFDHTRSDDRDKEGVPHTSPNPT